MAKRERVYRCANQLCEAWVVPELQAFEDWQEVRVRPLESQERAVVMALCPDHALRMVDDV